MSSTALSRALACAALSLPAAPTGASEPQHILACETAGVERTALRQAPMGARRVEKHVLEVSSKKGPQRFVDKPPHDEGGTGGVHWRYCGYDHRVKAHLIEMTDNGLFSGKLLLEETGEQIAAGHTVLFSPSGTEFLAIEQESGVDGEAWAVYDTRGQMKWKGYAGTSAKVNGVDTVVSTFERPRWSKQGELTAHFACAASRAQGTVALVRPPLSKTWSWRGHGRCT